MFTRLKKKRGVYSRGHIIKYGTIVLILSTVHNSRLKSIPCRLYKLCNFNKKNLVPVKFTSVLGVANGSEQMI